MQQQPRLATLPGVMKRPADPLHPLAPIFQPNEGAGRGRVKNGPALRSEKREIHLHAHRGDPPPPEPRVIPTVIDEAKNGDLAATQTPNRAICAAVGLKRRQASS